MTISVILKDVFFKKGKHGNENEIEVIYSVTYNE